MKISPQHTGPLQPARHVDQASRQRPQEVETRQTRNADRVDLDSARRREEGQDPASRVEALADKVSDRLANLAESTGADLSQVEADFAKNIDRLLAGIADGSLSQRDVANGIASSLEGVQREVAGSIERPELRGREEGRPDAAPIQERVEGLATEVESRIANLAGELGLDDDQAREFASSFQSDVDRLLAGVADGSIAGDAIESGLQNILRNVAESAQRASAEQPTRDGRVAGDAVRPTSAQDRFDAAVDSIEDRLTNLGEGLTGDQARAFQEPESSFQGAMDRLGSATFDGSIDRDEFQQLFQSLVDGLGEDLKGLLGGDLEAGSASLYHPITGVEQLGGGLPGGIDATG